MPQRIQLQRRAGWRKPEGAVVVARPSRWGNPIRIVPVHKSGPFDLVRDGVGFVAQHTGLESARLGATERFRDLVAFGIAPSVEEIRAALGGRDLACWCPLESACHGDILLRIAQGEEP